MSEKPEIEEAQQRSDRESRPGVERITPIRITPIIVVGINRSGTTWVSNLLCNHSQISGIQSELHYGIIETNMFGEIQRFVPDISERPHYVGFIELWSGTDFFRRTAIEKEFLYQYRPRPRHHFELFKVTMSEVARRRGNSFWIQKTSPLHLPTLLPHFEDARFVVIQRELWPLLRSTVQLHRNVGGTWPILRAICNYTLQTKMTGYSLRGKRNVIFLEYEKLTEKRQSELERLSEFIGVPFEPDMAKIPFQRNTSYAEKNKQNEVFSTVEIVTIRILFSMLKLLPLSVLKVMRRFLAANKPYFITGTFSDIIKEYEIDE